MVFLQVVLVGLEQESLDALSSSPFGNRPGRSRLMIAITASISARDIIVIFHASDIVQSRAIPATLVPGVPVPLPLSTLRDVDSTCVYAVPLRAV